MANEFGMPERMSGASPARCAVLGGRLVVAGMIATALLTGGCATTPATSTSSSASPIPVGTAQPGTVEGHLTSAVRRLAYTTEELADPATRSFIQDCERAGDSGCRENWKSEDRRQRFTLVTDHKVIARFEIGRMKARDSYAVACHFMDPAGSVVLAIRDSFQAPRETSAVDVITQSCMMDLAPTLATGKWAVSLTINGQTSSTLRFEILAVGERLT